MDGTDARGPRVLVVEHQASCPPALVGEWLAAAGARLDLCRPWAGDRLPDRVGGPGASHDALLVLGGEMGADDDAEFWWLAPLKALLGQAVETRLPTLGICLGHQLLAAALGGTVRRNPRGQAVGLREVGWTSAAADDPLLGPVLSASGPGGARGVQWNRDVVTEPPDGAVVLAEDAAGDLQVARFADAAWGVQLHPEVDDLVVRAWAEGDRADHLERGIDQQAVLAEIAAARAELEATWRPLAHSLLRLAAGGR